MAPSLYEHCICQRMTKLNPGLCGDEKTFSEKGIKARLIPREGEWAAAVALDGCVFTDQQTKCDGLFLLAGRGGGIAVLVELKGTEIEHAFAQLAFVRNHRPEYLAIKDHFAAHCGGRIYEKAFVVSSARLSEPKKEALEETWGIRVQAVLYCEPAAKIPNLRQYL